MISVAVIDDNAGVQVVVESDKTWPLGMQVTACNYRNILCFISILIYKKEADIPELNRKSTMICQKTGG